APYRQHFQDFVQHIAKAMLSVSPEIARKGERVTLEVNVIVAGGPARGRVIFKATTSLGMQNLGTKDLVNGRATLSTSGLPKGNVVLAAEYPTQNVPGVGEVVGDTDEVHYEVQ